MENMSLVLKDYIVIQFFWNSYKYSYKYQGFS